MSACACAHEYRGCDQVNVDRVSLKQVVAKTELCRCLYRASLVASELARDSLLT